jgi:phenylpropionate dioxygenase-like ring-hydroxylating dioxygenase large terminal subunit
MTTVSMVRPDTRSSEPTDQEVENHLRLGLRNRWYPILPSNLVRQSAEPVGVVRLGEPLVVWRDHSGVVHVQLDRCPHRAVQLSRGINAGDRLRCRYHGVEIGPDGTVLKVPGQPGCRLEGTKAVKTYPTLEIKGGIFVYFGDALHEEPVTFNLPPQLASDEYEAILCFTEWNMFWRYLYDNNMDPMHGTFLHANSHSMYQGEIEAHFRTRETSKGFVFEKEGQRDVNFDWSEMVDDGALFVRLEIPYPPSGGPGGNFGIISFGTPVDEDNTACFFWRVRKVTGWQRDTWRFLYKMRMESRHWHVLEQDRHILEGCKAGLEKYETLYQHDTGVVRLRRHILQEGRKQLRELKQHDKA